jgi:hypothetical protein
VTKVVGVFIFVRRFNGDTQIFSQNKLSGLQMEQVYITNQDDAGSPVSPLNNSTYLSFQSWPKALEVYQSIRIYRFRMRKSRKKKARSLQNF